MDQIKGLWKGLKAKSEEAVQSKPKWKGQGRVLGGAPLVRTRKHRPHRGVHEGD